MSLCRAFCFLLDFSPVPCYFHCDMFRNLTSQIIHNQVQLNYGVAVTDIDGDGEFEIFVTGYGFPNVILKWVGAGFVNITDHVLADVYRHAIGVAACDIDGG